MKNIYLFGIMIFIGFSLNAQKSAKWNEAIQQLEKSEFVQVHQANLKTIETTILEFKSNSEYIDEKDIELVKDGYIQSQQKFNALFDAMKNDFSNKKMRNFINSNPDRYFKGFRYDLEEAMKSYRNKCEKQIHQLIDLEDAAFGLTEFGILLGLAEKLGTLISNHISKMNKMSSEYFETHFIAKQRLKDWDSY